MKIDSHETTIDRFYTMLFWTIASTMPRKMGNLHPYSTGNMYRNMTATKLTNGWKIEISTGVDYSAYALGYRADGSKRQARTPLEEMNFAVLDNAIANVSKCFANTRGGVWLNGNRLY